MDVLHRVSKDSVVAEIRSLDSSGLGTSSRCNKGRGSLETRDKSLLSPPSLLPYGYETLWTPLADSEKRIQSFETKCLMKLHRISYSGHKTNDWVRSEISFLVGPQETLLATVKGRTFAWFGHVTRHDGLSKAIHLGGWATPWSAEKMLDGQCHCVDVLAHARTAHNSPPHKRLKEDLG